MDEDAAEGLVTAKAAGEVQPSDAPPLEQEQLIKQAEELRVKREAERAQLTKNQLRKARKKLSRLYQKALGPTGAPHQQDGMETSAHDYEDDCMPSTAMGPTCSDFTELSVNAGVGTASSAAGAAGLAVEEVTLTAHVTAAAAAAATMMSAAVETASLALTAGADGPPADRPCTDRPRLTSLMGTMGGQDSQQLSKDANPQPLVPSSATRAQPLLPRQGLAAARFPKTRPHGLPARGRGCPVDMSSVMHMLSGRAPLAPGSMPGPHTPGSMLGSTPGSTPGSMPGTHTPAAAAAVAAAALVQGSQQQVEVRSVALTVSKGQADMPASTKHARSRFYAQQVGNRTGAEVVVGGASKVAAAAQPSAKRKKQQAIYGNYHGYYGYRHASVDAFEDDPRLSLLSRDWFAGRHMLDVGCNEGLVTLAVALRFGTASTTGVDIDHALIHKARRNLRTLRTNMEQQLRTGPTRSWQHASSEQPQSTVSGPQSSVHMPVQQRAQQQDSVGHAPQGSHPMATVVERTSPVDIGQQGMAPAVVEQQLSQQPLSEQQTGADGAVGSPLTMDPAPARVSVLEAVQIVSVANAKGHPGQQPSETCMAVQTAVHVGASVQAVQEQGSEMHTGAIGDSSRAQPLASAQPPAVAANKECSADVQATAKLQPQMSGWASLRTAARALSAVNFIHQDWANEDQPAAAAQSSQTDSSRPPVKTRKRFGVIMCLSVTKWVHLNWGDEGLLRLFHKFNASLDQGGYLVLEPQPWRSYKAALVKKHSSGVAAQDLANLKLRPEGFVQLLTEGLGLCLLADLNQQSSAVGFDRPMYVFQKPSTGQGRPTVPRSLPARSHSDLMQSHSDGAASARQRGKKRPASSLEKGAEGACEVIAPGQSHSSEGIARGSHSTVAGAEPDYLQQRRRKKAQHGVANGPSGNQLVDRQQQDTGQKQKQQQQPCSGQQQEGAVRAAHGLGQDQWVARGSAQQQNTQPGLAATSHSRGSTGSAGSRKRSRSSRDTSASRAHRRQPKPEDLLVVEEDEDLL